VSAEPYELSVVVLCYRAGATIHDVLRPLHRLFDESGERYELVLVANEWPGRDDDTLQHVQQYAGEGVTILDNPKEGGMGWDLRSGLDAATGSTIVAIDGDAQNPVEDVLRMYRLMRETGADVGKGVRTNRADGLYRAVISGGYNFLFRLLFGTWSLWDINGKPKGLTRTAYEQMTLTSDDWFIDAELVLAARRMGMRIVELPVIFLENSQRASFVGLSSIWEFLRHMVRYRLLGHA
jgi:glycosyltransferase involved in cell wall biosynthesis